MKSIAVIMAAALLMSTAGFAPARADAGHFSAGKPGNAKKPARTITVTMHDEDGTMKFVPDRVEVKKAS